MATLALNLAIGFATSFLSSLLAPSSTTKQEGPRLNDLSAPKSSYGAGIPRVYGSARVAGNLFWSRAIREAVTTTTQRSGGKGGGGGGGTTQTTTTYTYYGTFAVLLAEGQIAGIKRIWLNSKLVYNIAPDADTNTYNSSINFANRLRIYYGSSSQLQDSLIAATQGINDTPAYRGRSYIVFDDIPLEDWGNRLPTVSVEVVQNGFFYAGRLYSVATNVGAIAQDICSRVGFNLADLDTTEINDIAVQGFWTNSNISARDALAQLQKAFFFDVIESGGKLKFIKQIRPGSPIAIPVSDLATHEYGQERPDDFNTTRTQDTEILDEVSVTYLDVDFAYQQASQSAKRQISPNKNKNDLKFDIVLSASTALSVAQKTLYLGWAQRRKFTFTLPLRYSTLEPGDIASIPFFGSDPQLVYILKINIGANFLLECEGIPYEPSLLALSAIATAPPISLTIPTSSSTTLKLLDINLVIDTDTDLGIYVAATGNSAWRNAGLYVSRNNGDSYDFAKSLLTKTITGTCNNILGAASEFTRDLGNTISVTITSGELESIGETDFLNGRNSALIGDEIIYFKNATLTAASTYTLTELLRGRRGTEWATSGHAASESFVLLSGYLERLEGQVLDLNSQRLYKAPVSTQTLADITATAFTTTGKSLKPYAPCQIKGVRDGSNNLTINWIRRTRKGGMLIDYKDADLSELSEAYEVDILSGSTVVRTLSTATPTATYSAANQTTDFGSTQSNVSVKIYQLSSYVGRGYAGVATI
ncbi:MAG: phage tail protein [Candidatus Nanopelagicaceae bacterium]